jgi:hypothetical protein
MRRSISLALFALGCSLRDLDYLDEASTPSGTGGGGPAVPIPGCSDSPGWCELADTKLHDQCPTTVVGSYDYSSACPQIVSLANGAIADPERHRMVLFGGGDAANETSYLGNEVYALELSPPKLRRLGEPSPLVTPINGCIDATDAPNPRVTYDNLALLPGADRMFLYGGTAGCPDASQDDTWMFELSSPAWHEQPKSGEVPPGSPGGVLDYDDVTHSVYLVRTQDGDGESVFFRYDVENETYSALGGGAPILLGAVGTIDPALRALVVIGANQAFRFDLDAPHARNPIPAGDGSCDALFAANVPGLEYDTRHQRLVGWTGKNDTLYVLDAATGTCAEQHHGPPPPAAVLGPVTRFRYFAEFDSFVTVTDADSNAFALRLEP